MRSEGAVYPSMMCMVVGFGANMLLDPLFIFGFGMGVAGAAWATDVAMVASCACALAYYLRGKSVVRLRWGRVRIVPAIARRAMGIGLSPFLQQTMSALIAVSLQVAFAFWLPDETARTNQIASLGVFQMTTLLFLMPMLGIQQGLAPIIGFNWGARNYARVRETVMLGLWTTTAVVTAAALGMVCCPEAIARLFADGSDVGFIRLVAHDLRLSNCMLWCIGLNVVATTYSQSVGRSRTAILLSLLRQVICLIPCTWLLPCLARATGLCAPATAIWLAMPISDVLACLATVPSFVSHARFLARVGRLTPRRA
jgi:Na+-driven multidrug efflux pump